MIILMIMMMMMIIIIIIIIIIVIVIVIVIITIIIIIIRIRIRIRIIRIRIMIMLMRLRGSFVTTSNKDSNSRGNMFWFWEVVVEALDECFFLLALDEFSIKASTSAHEYSKSNGANKIVVLLMYWLDKHRGLSQFPDAGCRALSALVPRLIQAPASHRGGFSAWG